MFCYFWGSIQNSRKVTFFFILSRKNSIALQRLEIHKFLTLLHYVISELFSQLIKRNSVKLTQKILSAFSSNPYLYFSLTISNTCKQIKGFYENKRKHMTVKKLDVTHTWDMIKDAAWQSCLIVSRSASFISKVNDAHAFKSQHIKITLQWD